MTKRRYKSPKVWPIQSFPKHTNLCRMWIVLQRCELMRIDYPLESIDTRKVIAMLRGEEPPIRKPHSWLMS